jgi:threonine/homoserine/homoserine lactone efflux protein
MVSGLGAALSDVAYAAITSLFMGLVVPFVETYMQVLEVSGTVVLGLFGAYLLKSNPARNLKKNSETRSTYVHDFVTAFLLTLSNALIVLLYIGLFAHFSFVLPAHSWWEIAKGLMGVAMGAVCWWFFITYLIYRLQQWFNIRSIHVLNRIVGAIIIALVVAQICYSYLL